MLFGAGVADDREDAAGDSFRFLTGMVGVRDLDSYYADL